MEAPEAAYGARRPLERRAFMTLVAASLLVAPLEAEAQRLLYYEGTVQWIAGSTMVIATDDGWSLRVDLTRVPQSDYSGLGLLDRVIVTGLLSSDGNYLIERYIQRTRLDHHAP